MFPQVLDVKRGGRASKSAVGFGISPAIRRMVNARIVFNVPFGKLESLLGNQLSSKYMSSKYTITA
jgi:hypothetical protein